LIISLILLELNISNI